jgi:ribulose bisphosphate carboxylase small subunit
VALHAHCSVEIVRSRALEWHQIKNVGEHDVNDQILKMNKIFKENDGSYFTLNYQ